MKFSQLIQLTLLFIYFILPVNAISGEWSAMSSGTTCALNGVWGTSGTDVFAVGNAFHVLDEEDNPIEQFATILHYNGTTWSSMISNTDLKLMSVNGNQEGDIYAAGYHDYNYLGDITFGGGILKCNVNSWVEEATASELGLRGIWIDSEPEIFAVGFLNSPHGACEGIIWHYNGTAWSVFYSYEASDMSSDGGLWGVWGSSNSDVFAVGINGTILHYNGSSWETMTSGTTNPLYGIWGSSGSNVFAVGGNGTILHYNGSSWSAMTSGTTITFNGIWGSSESDVFAVGGNGTILHYNGSNWSAMTSGTKITFNAIWGSSGSDVFAVGADGTIFHYNEAVLISLSSFTAEAVSKKVMLTWSTDSEIDNAGFNIYRAEKEDGEYMKINNSLIPARGAPAQGITYEFTDYSVQNRETYFYKLEDIDLNGKATSHGPISATPRLLYMFQ